MNTTEPRAVTHVAMVGKGARDGVQGRGGGTTDKRKAQTDTQCGDSEYQKKSYGQNDTCGLWNVENPKWIQELETRKGMSLVTVGGRKWRR